MSLKQSNNKNNSLQILNILFDGKTSKTQLLDMLQIKASTFYRHLNLIREIGFNISRDNDIYELIRFKNCFNFAKYELSIFTYILLLAHTMLPKAKSSQLLNVVRKILCLATKEEYEIVKEKYDFYRSQIISDYYKDKIIALNKYISDNAGIIISTKDGKKLKAKPINLSYGKKEKIYLDYINQQSEKKSICLDSIVKIAQNDKKIEIEGLNETIFELYGKLAKSYLLKEDERIIDATKDKLVVANSSSDKTVLFKRLLRYDILCKVIFPKKDVDAFKMLIEKILANIE